MKIVHSYEEITDWFFTTLGELQQTKQTIFVGLAGGASFDGWYKYLLENTKHKTQNTAEFFKGIRWCVTDERVNCDTKDRNDAHIWEVFLGPLCEMGYSKPEYFIRPEVDDDGLKYSKRIGTIDIAFFGMGPDGHTASIFPYSQEISEFLETPLNPPLSGGHGTAFIFINDSPKPPPERISLSPQSLQILEHVCLFAVGSQKKEALENFFNENISFEECPVKLLKPDIVLDRTEI